MDADKVIQDLNRRFAAPLPEFYNRRIIFWYDEDGEFEDKLDEITLENANLVALTNTNNFAVKKLLSYYFRQFFRNLRKYLQIQLFRNLRKQFLGI